MASYEPLYDRVMIRREDSEERTKGGLIIPENAQEKPQRGIVVAVGHGKLCESSGELAPLKLVAGDTVYFGKYSGSEIRIDGEDLLIMKESDVLLVERS